MAAMQITPAPLPIVPNASPQDMAAKTAAPVLAQAAAPVTQRAIDPAPKSENGQRTRSNNERSKGGGRGNTGNAKSEHSINIKV